MKELAVEIEIELAGVVPYLERVGAQPQASGEGKLENIPP